MDVAVQDAYANQKLWAATTVKVLHPLSTAKFNLLATPILYDLLLLCRNVHLFFGSSMILCWPTSKTLARLYHWRL